jgi:hypothetical protein
MGMWSRTPMPNWASHGADAWMQYAQTSGNAPGKAIGEDDERPARRPRNWKAA